jgi:hypothetical protein
MVIGILVLIYVVYLLIGIEFKFPVGWLDWNSPYLHYVVIASYQDILPALIAPFLALIWLGYVWYRKSMIGEA